MPVSDFNFIGYSFGLNRQPFAAWDALITEQVEIVERCDIAGGVLSFFRTVDITINDYYPRSEYRDLTGVTLRPRDLAADSPILLHELLHAYRRRWMRNPERLGQLHALLDDAEDRDLFLGCTDMQYCPRRQRMVPYMRIDLEEYFAMGAQVFLIGSAKRQPFSRQNLNRVQPEYFSWLSTEFPTSGVSPPVP